MGSVLWLTTSGAVLFHHAGLRVVRLIQHEIVRFSGFCNFVGTISQSRVLSSFGVLLDVLKNWDGDGVLLAVLVDYFLILLLLWNIDWDSTLIGTLRPHFLLGSSFWRGGMRSSFIVYRVWIDFFRKMLQLSLVFTFLELLVLLQDLLVNLSSLLEFRLSEALTELNGEVRCPISCLFELVCSLVSFDAVLDLLKVFILTSQVVVSDSKESDLFFELFLKFLQLSGLQ